MFGYKKVLVEISGSINDCEKALSTLRNNALYGLVERRTLLMDETV